MINSLQFHKLVRQQNESAEEWISRLRISATECNCNDVYQHFKEQFIHDLNDNDMMDEIISQLTKGKNKNVTINQVLPWAR